MAKPHVDSTADVATVRQALADARGPDKTFLERIDALEQAVDLLLRELAAR